MIKSGHGRWTGNGHQLLPIHHQADEWVMNPWPIHSSPLHHPFIPIHPPEDEWIKVDPHSSPLPIHLPCPAKWSPLLKTRKDPLKCYTESVLLDNSEIWTMPNKFEGDIDVFQRNKKIRLAVYSYLTRYTHENTIELARCSQNVSQKT